MKTIAWLAILISTPLFNVLVNQMFFRNTATERWSDIVKVSLLGVLIAIALMRPQLRPIVGFLVVLMAFSIGYLFVNLFEEGHFWLNFRNSAPAYQWVMADSLAQFLPAGLMLVVACAYGQTGKSSFLTRGDLSAPSVITLFGLNASWMKLTPLFSILFLVMTCAFLVFRFHEVSGDLLFSKLITAFPYLILFPIVNAVIEEIRYRNVLLAFGEPVVGGFSALLMTTALFGLSHVRSFLGTSGSGGSLIFGMAYALGAAYMGWIAGRSILETHGILAAWIMHASADLVIILGYIFAV